MKRSIDVVLSILALVVLSPLLVPVMIILKLTGEHYVFYRQDRIGKRGRPFELLKFATMLKDSPNLGTGDITTRSDPRVLPVGRILRRTKINELPQILNVLKGDMSLIGPRPVTPKHFQYYSDEVKEVIGRMRPGLSGVGSIVFRDEEALIADSDMAPEESYRQLVSPYKGELEVWYYENQSLLLDWKLIALTILVILKPGLDVYKYVKGLPQWPDVPWSGEFKMSEQLLAVKGGEGENRLAQLRDDRYITTSHREGRAVHEPDQSSPTGVS